MWEKPGEGFFGGIGWEERCEILKKDVFLDLMFLVVLPETCRVLMGMMGLLILWSLFLTNSLVTKQYNRCSNRFFSLINLSGGTHVDSLPFTPRK